MTYINSINTNIEKCFCVGGYFDSQFPGMWVDIKAGKMGSTHPYVYFNRGYVNGNEITSDYGIAVWGR